MLACPSSDNGYYPDSEFETLPLHKRFSSSDSNVFLLLKGTAVKTKAITPGRSFSAGQFPDRAIFPAKRLIFADFDY